MAETFVLVLITAPSQEVAEGLARHLLERRLAACVNILSPVRSLYRWQGAIEEAEEVLLLVKSRAALLDEAFIPAVKALHPYQVPEVIAFQVGGGLEDYLRWVGEETIPSGGSDE